MSPVQPSVNRMFLPLGSRLLADVFHGDCTHHKNNACPVYKRTLNCMFQIHSDSFGGIETSLGGPVCLGYGRFAYIG